LKWPVWDDQPIRALSFQETATKNLTTTVFITSLIMKLLNNRNENRHCPVTEKIRNRLLPDQIPGYWDICTSVCLADYPSNSVDLIPS
jgi:hypothetical protein